ncbi:MAG: hypothetical protein Q9190_006980 [Brigantiaea leucoxantha]
MQPEQQVPKSQPQRKKRLKDSCDNCAASKVKCNKVKPTCTRCQDRGITCQYAPSQRSGRKATPSSASTTAPASTTVTPPSEPIQFDALNLTPSNTPLSLISDHSMGSLPSLASDTSLGSLGSLGMDNSQFPDFPMNDFSSEPMWGVGPFSNLNLDASFDSSIMSPPCFANTTANNDIFGSMDKVFQTDPMPRPRANTTPLRTSPPPLAPNFDSMDMFLSDFGARDIKAPTAEPNRPHSCLTLALNILPILHIPPQSCTLVSVSPTSCDTPTVDNIIATNKKIIESLSIMLDCPCSLDEQLASILALITFKIMNWYAAAARGTDIKHTGSPKVSGGSPLSNVSKYDLDGTDNARMRAQLILSELHRVVRFLERLSCRYEEAIAQRGADISMSGCGSAEKSSSGAMSSSVFTQLRSDLKDRLQGVAKETMTILRGGQ